MARHHRQKNGLKLRLVFESSLKSSMLPRNDQPPKAMLELSVVPKRII
jgi:hypothetical protein